MYANISVIMLCLESEAVAGEVLHHGLPDKAPLGDPRAHLECHGSIPIPAGHSALPALLPPAQSAAAGGRYRWPLQSHPGPLSNPGPAGFHHRTLQVLEVDLAPVLFAGYNDLVRESPGLRANLSSSCRSTILLDSKSLLQGRAVSDQAIAEALVSTMLLEDSSPRQALADFLLARKASIHQLLNQPQHGT